MWKFLWRLYMVRSKRRHIDLLVMRLEDMWIQHPDQDNSRTCNYCGKQVGVYPDGQEIIKTYGKENVVLICQICSLPPYLKDEK